jgi:monovalent cation:H+ antiporter-2, CPA2 family
MHGISFLQDLAAVMIVAGLVTIIFHRLKQPVVLGYIVAGVIMGPHTPPFSLITDEETVHTLSEMGVVLLMFSLGLEFSLGKLKRVGATAFIAAAMEIILMLGIGYQIGRWFGWSQMDSIFLGAMLSISSTTIIVKALAELGKSKERFAELIFGILIVEDILAIAIIALLSGIAQTGSLQVSQVFSTVSRLGVFLVVALVLGLLVVPRLIGYVARFKSNEMLLITVLGLCFGFSLLAVKLNYSMALGAFVIGAVIAEAREIHLVENLIAPVRDMFSAIFFVAIGLLIDPHLLVQYWLPITVITIAVVIGKVLTCSFGTFVAGNDTRTSLRVGMGLAQIGEFSFIIAALGLNLNVTSKFLYPIAVTVSAITTLLTPYLIKSSDGLVNWFSRAAPKSFINSLELYTHWLGQKGDKKNPAANFIRRWTFQIIINAMLVAGVFLAAVFVAQQNPEWLKHIPLNEIERNALIWFAAVFLSLPMLIAAYRKLEALGMLLGELRVKQLSSDARAKEIKAVISTTVPLAGAVGLGVLVFSLSAPLLPSWEILIVLLLVLAGLTFLLWRSFVKVYSKAQIAIQETLASTPLPHETATPAPLQNFLKDARLQTFSITAASPARGKFLRELGLRTQTGASIVAIERNGVNLVNPGPDDELQINDQILVLGSETQIEKARQLLLEATH